MTKNKLHIITFFCIFAVLGANHAKGAVATHPHGDEHLQKYAQRPEFDASVPLFIDIDVFHCSSSRVKIDDNDPFDFYITAAHCVNKKPRSLLLDGTFQEVDIVIHPRLDLAIFTTGEQSNQSKYPLYRGNLIDLIGRTATHVGFGMSELDPKNSFKRQAFDTTIGYGLPSILALMKYGDINKVLYSTWPMSSWIKTIEDNPRGRGTPGDSGGSLLVKEEDGYKLVGTTNGGILLSKLLFRYDPFWLSFWHRIDLDFIERAKKELLAKKAVYAYPSQPKIGFPTIDFLLSNKNSFTEMCPLEMGEKHFIGHAFTNTELIISVEGEEFFNIPFEIGRTIFICQLAQKHYLIEVTIEKAVEGEGFLVKGVVLNKEKDRCVAPLADELMLGNNKHGNGIFSGIKIRPVYYSLSNIYDLSLDVSLRNYLPKSSIDTDLLSIDTNLLKNKKILGYAGDSYDIVIRLNGRNLKILNNKEIGKDTKSFEFQYAGENYGIYFQRKSEGYNKEDHIDLSVEKFPATLTSYESMNESGKYFREVSITPFSRSVWNNNMFEIKVIKGAAIYRGDKDSYTYYASKDSEIELTIDGRVVSNFSIDKKGCHYVTYKKDGILYIMEVKIRLYQIIGDICKVTFNVKRLDEELIPASESCESETGGNLVEYALTDSSKVIASDLNLHIILDGTFSQEKPLSKGCVGYGNKNSIACILSNSKELGKFTLHEMENSSRSIEFENDGKFYSMNLKAIFEGNRWRILLDVHEIQEGGPHS